MKIRPVGAELFHADGQTDMTKLIVALHSSANASEKKEPQIYPFQTYIRTDSHMYWIPQLRCASSF